MDSLKSRCPAAAPDNLAMLSYAEIQCVRTAGHGHTDHTNANGTSWPVTPPSCPFAAGDCTSGCSDPVNRACVDGL